MENQKKNPERRKKIKEIFLKIWKVLKLVIPLFIREKK